MDPIRKLMDEHRVIETVLGAIPGYAAAVRRGEADAREDLGRFVAFIREYADAYHHGKEEDMLFVEMTKRGMSNESGPIAVMLADHVEGRGYVATLHEIAGGEGPLSAEEAEAAVQAAGSYMDLLGAHIMKEDQVLYPMAQQMLPPDAMEELAHTFENYEEREAAAAELHVGTARALSEKYGG